MKLKGILSAAIIAASLIIPAAAASAQDITVVVDGQTIETPSPAVIVNDRTLVPLRAISESIGFDVSWDGATQGITITDGQYLFFLWIGKDHAFLTNQYSLAGHSVMEATPVIMNDYTMVPLRAIASLFGAEVNWDANTYTVNVNFGDKVAGPKGLAEKYVTYEQVLWKKYDEYKGYVDGTGNVVNAEIQLESGKNIELELYPDIAPVTVNNFEKLAKEHFYDGLIFHRVISGFMIQGGGFDKDYVQKSAPTITGEFISNGYFNLIPHRAGAISMARTSQSNDSASSQFFIVHEDSGFLDGQYAAFGKVTSGMEYVNEIAAVPTEHNDVMNADDVPVEQQVIKTIVIK